MAPVKPERPWPSLTDCWKASSRFGPDGALGPGAGEHVTGAALGDEQLLAGDEVGVRRPPAAPSRRSARSATAATASPRERGPQAGCARGLDPSRAALYLRPRAAGCRQRVPAPRRSTPAATPSHDKRSRAVATSAARVRGPQVGGRLQPRPTRSAIARTAPSSTGNDSQSRGLGRHRGRQQRADLRERRSGRPRPAARRRPRPRRRPCRRPRGRCSGTTSASQPASSGASSSCSRRPVSTTRSRSVARGRPGRLALAGARGVEERQQVAQRRARAALERAPGARDRLDGRVEVARGQRVQQALAGRRGRRRSRRPRAARRDVASTSGHAATSRSTPLETISLPTNAHEAVARRGRGGASARAGRRRVARERPSPPSSARRPTARRSVERRHARPRPRARAAELVDVDARRARGACARAARRRPSPPTGSRRCGASRRARSRAARAPRGRTAGSARDRA